MMNNLFANKTNEAVSTNAREIRGSSQLVAMSDTATNNFLAFMNDREDKEAAETEMTLSFTNNTELDRLIGVAGCVTEDMIALYKELGLIDTEVDKTLKSQQSKRSRARSKQMTLDNYKSLVSAAIAEDVIRTAYDKPKSQTANYSVDGALLTDEEIADLKADKEKLAKAIRNIQSKKSIAKAKADHDETSDKWLALLAQEAALKACRGDATTVTVVEVPTEVVEAQEMIKDVEVEKLSAKDAKAMIASLQAKLAGLQ